jgi:hypothetical protein
VLWSVIGAYSRADPAPRLVESTIHAFRDHALGFVYRGICTEVMPFGPIKVPVPLPLFISRPCPAPPGNVVVCIRPTRPVVMTGPRGVNTGCPESREIDGAESNRSAKAGPADRLRAATAANAILFMMNSPFIVPRRAGLSVIGAMR